ncbi:MAG: hypothetical protein J0H57_10335 [Rhodospirillales bacterium]|nr:hypothetical protein [Rhodospirillales bacterium]
MKEEIAAEYVGLSVSTFRREWSEGRAPFPVLLTPGRQVWLRDDLDEWLDAKAGRTTKNGQSEEWDKAIERRSSIPSGIPVTR